MELLASIEVSLNQTTYQDIYTVPTNRQLIVTDSYFHSFKEAAVELGDTSNLRLYRSISGGVEFARSPVVGMVPNTIVPIVPQNGTPMLQAGEKVQFRPDAAWDGGETAILDLWGYLTDIDGVPQV